ncbi:unnamed protein product, partial [marine sediment metagenome]
SPFSKEIVLIIFKEKSTWHKDRVLSQIGNPY